MAQYSSMITILLVLTSTFAQVDITEKKILSGHNFSLTCPIEDEPRHKSIRWIKDGVIVQEWANLSTVHFVNATTDQSGIYRCHGNENAPAEGSAAFDVLVGNLPTTPPPPECLVSRNKTGVCVVYLGTNNTKDDELCGKVALFPFYDEPLVSMCRHGVTELVLEFAMGYQRYALVTTTVSNDFGSTPPESYDLPIIIRPDPPTITSMVQNSTDSFDVTFLVPSTWNVNDPLNYDGVISQNGMTENLEVAMTSGHAEVTFTVEALEPLPHSLVCLELRVVCSLFGPDQGNYETLMWSNYTGEICARTPMAGLEWWILPGYCAVSVIILLSCAVCLIRRKFSSKGIPEPYFIPQEKMNYYMSGKGPPPLEKEIFDDLINRDKTPPQIFDIATIASDERVPTFLTSETEKSTLVTSSDSDTLRGAGSSRSDVLSQVRPTCLDSCSDVVGHPESLVAAIGSEAGEYKNTTQSLEAEREPNTPAFEKPREGWKSFDPRITGENGHSFPPGSNDEDSFYLVSSGRVNNPMTGSEEEELLPRDSAALSSDSDSTGYVNSPTMLIPDRSYPNTYVDMDEGNATSSSTVSSPDYKCPGSVVYSEVFFPGVVTAAPREDTDSLDASCSSNEAPIVDNNRPGYFNGSTNYSGTEGTPTVDSSCDAYVKMHSCSPKNSIVENRIGSRGSVNEDDDVFSALFQETGGV